MVAWCLEAHDLVLSKRAAGRARDWDYAADALRAGIVGLDLLSVRARELPVSAQAVRHIEEMLAAMADADQIRQAREGGDPLT